LRRALRCRHLRLPTRHFPFCCSFLVDVILH
jgi:hypothetical protein